MSGLSDFDQALAEAEEERRAERAAMLPSAGLPAAVRELMITEDQIANAELPPPAPVEKEPKRRGKAPKAAIDDAISHVVSEDAAEKFVAAVRAYLKATAVRRADRTLFDDRCVACERRGVHSRDRFRCDCPCHEIRKLLPAA